MKLALITRCKNEQYVNEFVNHYLNEGVDRIYIIDDSSISGLYQKVSLSPQVEIVYDIPFGRGDSSELKTLYRRIRDDYDWVLVVDLDEYVTTRKNARSTLKNELLTTFRHSDCVKIPWVMMAFNGQDTNPSCLLQNNVYRWNHDRKHQHFSGKRKFRCRYEEIEVKCVFKTSVFNSCWDHGPVAQKNQNIQAVDSVYNRRAHILHDRNPSHPFYENLREEDISRAFLVCYHFRVTSKQHCIDKVRDNLFEDYKDLDAEDFLRSDFPEVKDTTLSLKSQVRPNLLRR
jgi:hypothetical protein